MTIPARSTASSPGAPTVAPPTGRVPSGDLFRAHLRALAADDRRLDATVGRSLSAGAHDSASLLALQMDVYRYSTELELAGRLLERATSAVRQILQSGT